MVDLSVSNFSPWPEAGAQALNISTSEWIPEMYVLQLWVTFHMTAILHSNKHSLLLESWIASLLYAIPSCLLKAVRHAVSFSSESCCMLRIHLLLPSECCLSCSLWCWAWPVFLFELLAHLQGIWCYYLWQFFPLPPCICRTLVYLAFFPSAWADIWLQMSICAHMTADDWLSELGPSWCSSLTPAPLLESSDVVMFWLGGACHSLLGMHSMPQLVSLCWHAHAWHDVTQLFALHWGLFKLEWLTWCVILSRCVLTQYAGYSSMPGIPQVPFVIQISLFHLLPQLPLNHVKGTRITWTIR